MPEIEWNNSSLMLLESCGEAFRRRIINKEQVPPSVRMARGTIVHAATGRGLLRKMNEGVLPTVEEARDLAADLFEETWAQGVTVDGEDVEDAGSEGAVRAEAKDFSIALTALHTEKVAPGINPVAVERKIVIKPQDSDLVIHGTMDLVHADPDGGEHIRDTKTSTKSPNKNAAETSQQFDMYGLLRTAETGKLPVGYGLDYLVRTPAKKDLKYVPLTTTRTAEDLQTMVARINVAVDAVKKGVFVPTSPDNWRCSRSWCEFYETCIYVKRGNRPQN